MNVAEISLGVHQRKKRTIRIVRRGHGIALASPTSDTRQVAVPHFPASVTEANTIIDDVEFTYLEAGTGPLAICMHGFPDNAHGWTSLLTALGSAGFHAVAPFARGYAPTAVPPDGTSPIGAWVTDVIAFHNQLGDGEAGVLIGHDWGALASYGAAVVEPDRWTRLVTASVPPAAAMSDRVNQFGQIRAFWYQWFFMLPGAEDAVARNDLAFIDELWNEWSPGFDTSGVLDRVKISLRDPANLTAALSTYRTTYDMTALPERYMAEQMAVFSPHTQPTLYIHGADDGCIADLSPNELDASLPHGSLVEIVSEAGHFVQYEQPEIFNALVVEFLTTK